jgi:acetyl esterase
MIAGQQFLSPDGPDLARVTDDTVQIDDHEVRFRHYIGGDQRAELAPAVLFFHGGGWVLGNLDTHDWICKQIAHQARCHVIALDYRCAPEAKFPAALNDCAAFADWLFSHARARGIDATKLVVAGDSAGGNLAAVVSQLRADKSETGFCAQMLFYPVVDISHEHPSYQRNAEGYFLTAQTMRWFISQYVSPDCERSDPRVSPLCAPDLSDSPRTLIVTAGFDPLCDEGLAYATKLAQSGVDVTHRHLPHQIHAFLSMSRHLPDASAVLAEVADFLRHTWES